MYFNIHSGSCAPAERDLLARDDFFTGSDALDKLIAAHALSLGLTLVTNNEQDFRAYPDLLIENWPSIVSA